MIRELLNMAEDQVGMAEPTKVPVDLIHQIDASLCRSGVSDDKSGRRARQFWHDVVEKGHGVYYISDGGYTRLIIDLWREDAPKIGIDWSLATEYARAQWATLGAV